MNNSPDIQVFKYLSQILLGLAAILLILYFYADYAGNDLALPWQVNASYFSKPLFLEYFQSRGEAIGFHIDQYINWQQYGVGSMKFIAWPHWVLLGCTLLCFWLLATASTYFSRFWYLVSMGVIIVILMQMNLIELGLWGEYGTYVALAIVMLSTYFFHAIKTSASLSLRLFVIGLLMGCYMVAVAFFGTARLPGLTAINYGLAVPIILSLIFMVFVAGENIYSIIRIATAKGGNGKQNLFHFITFGLIYMIMIIFFFLNRRGLIDFELSFISPFILLIISGISAFLSFELRLEKLNGILPISVLKQWVYPSFFLTALALITYARVTANDPLLDALEYAIILPHLAVGAIYFVAAFINFTPLILENLDVHKVFYKPQVAPMFLQGLGTLAFLTAVLFYVDFYPYYQARAGMYNALGDLSEKKNEEILAEQYYKRAVSIDFVNFKSNFQMAKYEKKNDNMVNVIRAMENTFFKHASGKGYTALASYYANKNQLFNTLFTLKQGMANIDSEEIRNNLAFAHRQFNQYDSAFMLLNGNWESQIDDISGSNLLALATELPAIGTADSLINALVSSEVRASTNALVMANNNGIRLPFEIELAKDTFLLQDDLFYLYNASLNHRDNPDPEILEALEYYLSSPYNLRLRAFLHQARAIQFYALGEVNKAFQTVEHLTAIDNRNSARYNVMLGVWALHQNQRVLSNEYFGRAVQLGFDENELLRMQNAVLGEEIPAYVSPLDVNMEEVLASNDSIAALNQMEQLARANAFDEDRTLQLVVEMQKWGGQEKRVYQILLEANGINKYSVPIFQAYVLSAVDMGLSEYALNALPGLQSLMPKEAFDSFRAFVEQRILERRNALFQ